MKLQPESDRVLRLADAVLADLAVRTAMYVGLSRRLARRGVSPAVRTTGVESSRDQLVADFGLVEVNDELLRILAEVAAPLPVTTHRSPDLAIRTLARAR